jgi:hypothetical protein
VWRLHIGSLRYSWRSRSGPTRVGSRSSTARSSSARLHLRSTASARPSSVRSPSARGRRRSVQPPRGTPWPGRLVDPRSTYRARTPRAVLSRRRRVAARPRSGTPLRLAGADPSRLGVRDRVPQTRHPAPAGCPALLDRAPRAAHVARPSLARRRLRHDPDSDLGPARPRGAGRCDRDRGSASCLATSSSPRSARGSRKPRRSTLAAETRLSVPETLRRMAKVPKKASATTAPGPVVTGESVALLAAII